MKVLIVGHGAREHAIAKKLTQEDLELVAAMGRINPGIASLSKQIEIIDLNNPQHFERFKEIDLAVIGPESVLAAGISDKLLEMEVPVMGPRKSLAKLEWSKAYTRIVLKENRIKGNPKFKICRNKKDVIEFIKKELIRSLRNSTQLRCGVELHLHGSLKRCELKSKRFKDLRKKE